jgi:hypothetical protein
MAFNPFKNKVISTPDDPEVQNNIAETVVAPSADEELINYTNVPVSKDAVIELPMQFEGTKVSDLQEVGMETISLLKVASKNAINKQKFNIPLLQQIPLIEVINHFGGTEIKKNSYLVLDRNIVVKEGTNKWFDNGSVKKDENDLFGKAGHSNALNLTKRLIAIQEHLNEADNDKILFKSAGNLLTQIYENLQQKNNVDTLIIENEVSETNAENNETPTIVNNVDSNNDNAQEENTTPVIVNPEAALTYEQKKEKWAKEKARKTEVTNALKEIPLDVVLEYIGANANEDGQSGKWKIHDTSHNVGVTGQLWSNWNTLTTGYGGIDLLADVIMEKENLRITTKEEKYSLWNRARAELLSAFGKDIEEDSYKDMEIKIKLKEPFYMPHVIDFKLNEVKNYLHEKRGLPMWIINKQVQEGLLFAGAHSHWDHIPFLHNPEKLSNDYVWAIFLSVNGEAAETRGIQRNDASAKMLAKGSNKDTGGFMLLPEADVNEKIAVSLEASIDACSYHALYPGRAASSCMGVNFNLAVNNALQALQYPSWKFELAFDNDFAGNEATVRFKERMIEEVGEDQYNEFISTGRIKYFDLAIRCVQECIAQDKIYYFDVSNNVMGKEAATMFQQQLSKVIPMPEIRQLIKNGKLKYANICPIWEKAHDPVYEAQQAFNLLNSDKPYYLRLKSIEDDKEDSAKLTARRNLFEKTFKELSQEKYQQWVNEGKIIDKKESFAKDWNEYFVNIQSKPEVRKTLNELEAKYGAIYTPVINSKLKKKM